MNNELMLYNLLFTVTRDRMGRMLTFVARIQEGDVFAAQATSSQTIRGVGIDEHTALLLDVTNGDISAVGVGTAYICAADHKAAVCEPREYLTFGGE